MNTRQFDTDNIHRLVACYYEGETTPEQEMELRDYFMSTSEEHLPEDLRSISKVFRLMGQSFDGVTECAPENLETRLLTAIDKFEVPKRTHRGIIWPWIGAAAVVALIVGLFLPKIHVDTQPKDTGLLSAIKANPKAYTISDNYIIVEDEEESRQLIKSTMLLVGNKMAIASKMLDNSSKKMDEFNITLKKILKNEKD